MPVFYKRGYPAYVVQEATIMPNKLINSQYYQWLRRKTVIAFHSLTVRPHNHAVKSIILKNFKLRQNNSETGHSSMTKR